MLCCPLCCYFSYNQLICTFSSLNLLKFKQMINQPIKVHSYLSVMRAISTLGPVNKCLLLQWVRKIHIFGISYSTKIKLDLSSTQWFSVGDSFSLPSRKLGNVQRHSLFPWLGYLLLASRKEVWDSAAYSTMPFPPWQQSIPGPKYH